MDEQAKIIEASISTPDEDGVESDILIPEREKNYTFMSPVHSMSPISFDIIHMLDEPSTSATNISKPP